MAIENIDPKATENPEVKEQDIELLSEEYLYILHIEFLTNII